MEEILAQVKYTVRQGLGTAISTQLRSQFLGGRQGGNLQARMWQMREINFDSHMISTPDWLWEVHPPALFRVRVRMRSLLILLALLTSLLAN